MCGRHFFALTESAPSMTIREVERSPAVEAQRWELLLRVPDERFNDSSLGEWRCRLHVSPLTALPCCFSLLSVSLTCSQPFGLYSHPLSLSLSLSVSMVSFDPSPPHTFTHYICENELPGSTC